MPLDIHGKRLILVIILTWSLGQMHMHYTLPQRTFDIKLEAQMLCAPLVCLFGTAEVAVARPSRPRAFAKCSNFSTGAEEFLTSGVLAYHSCRAVEVGSLGGGTEDIGEEKVANAALDMLLMLRSQREAG
jgi:hypothetical protein